MLLVARPGRLSALFFATLLIGACAQGSGLAVVGAAGSGGAGGSSGSGGAGGGSAGASAGSGGTSGTAGAGATDGGAGDSSAGGPSDASTGGSSGAPPGDAGACTGVVCNTPPASVCSGSDLQVYEAVGTCNGGTCSYQSSTTPCPNGCASGACVGDPCIGVTCSTPPASTCSDSTHLGVSQSPGTCGANGTCSYNVVQAYCPFGCQNDVCVGDPCAGISCTTPTASYCKDANNLTVYDSPGTCSNGVCAYPTTHDVFCAFGCSGTQCTGDPCAGKVCATPPAANCKDANTARTYASSGTCSGGVCSYAETDANCPYGCVNGVCKDCQIDANCPSGKFCQGGTCVTCDTAQHCGSACTDCSATSKVCSAGQCVECTGTGLCTSGKYCSNNVCVACNDNTHCGASCVACGSGTSCNGTTCAACDTDAKCGATCAPCGGATPHCQPNGAQSKCVECLSNTDCSGGNTCDTATGTCKPPCPTTLTSVFSDDFASPSSSSWTTGSGVEVTTSRWYAYTTAHHGIRITGGRMEITNATSSTNGHGQGYAYVTTGGAGSAYDNGLYNPTLKQNVGESVVWTLNMHRDDPDSTSGGFSCSSTSSQNYITTGLAYVLATDSAGGLNSSSGTCSSSATGHGYAVVLGGSSKIRLVRFSGGLRNGTLTDLVASGNFSVSNYFSVRVTYNATSDQWTLEARSDGSSSFADPASGSYSYTGNATDATYVNEALDYAGPYFQTGCCCLCSSIYTARFDNVGVGVRCAP